MQLGESQPHGDAAAARSTNLDMLRAAAALYVLAGHAYLLSGTSIGFHDRHPVRLAINTGGSGVWLFFALSGYLISGPFIAALHHGAPLPDVRDYAVRRVLRIYPAYWVALVGVVILGEKGPLSVAQWAGHGALLHNLRPGWQQAVFFGSWTLSLEVLFYLAVPLGALVVRRLVDRPLSVRELTCGTLALWIGSVAFVAVVPYLGFSPTNRLWLRILFPSMVSMFCPGILVAIAVAAERAGHPPRLYTALRTRRRESLVALLLLAVAGALGATVAEVRLYDAARQLFALASGLTVLLAVTRGPVQTAARLLTWLGTVSYGIYLWQGVVIYAIDRHASLTPLRNTSYLAYGVHVTLLLALTLPCAWASWRLIEQPAIRWSRRRRVGGPRPLD